MYGPGYNEYDYDTLYGNNGLGCSSCYESGMGIALPLVGSAISSISNLFGGGPKDTTGTQTFINGLLQRALAGDVKADHQIRCLAGDSAYAKEFNSTSCGYAHSEDRAVAQSAVDVLNSRVPSQAGSTAYQTPTQAGVSQAGLLPSTIGGMSVGPLLLAGVAGFAALSLLKKGRR